jgi:hypothetical protein
MCLLGFQFAEQGATGKPKKPYLTQRRNDATENPKTKAGGSRGFVYVASLRRRVRRFSDFAL